MWTFGPGLCIGPIDGLTTYPEGPAMRADVALPIACTSLFAPGRYKLKINFEEFFYIRPRCAAAICLWITWRCPVPNTGTGIRATCEILLRTVPSLLR